MKTSSIAIIGIVVIIGASVVTGISKYYSAYNYGAATETTIQAEYENMENILAQYSLKVMEVAQVPGMKKDDLVEVMSEAFTGRYGEGGSKATFQWIQENYPGEVSDQTYTQIQQVMEAGRNKFENAQSRFIDIKRGYTTALKKDLFLSEGWWLKQGGYPKIDLDAYAIISSDHASQTFENKIDTGIKLR